MKKHLGVGVSLFFTSVLVFSLALEGQVPPPSTDNFLDDEDFDAPPSPPGSYQQNPYGGFNGTGRKNFNDSSINNPQDSQFNSPPPSGNGSIGGKLKAAKPIPRRNRKEPTNLLTKLTPNMADASDKDITDENFPDLIDSFDYPNAEITDIVKAISELTGKNFIIDTQVRGKITIIAPTRITVAEAYKAFLSALAINGLTVVPSGKFLKIKQANNAQRDNLDTYSGAYSPNTDSMITRIVQLRYIQAKEVYNSLGPILQSRLGEMRVYEPTNTLIMSDYGSNIERIMKILRQIDVPGFEEQLEVVRVRYARAADIAKLVDQIINKGKGSGSQGNAFTAGIPRFTPLGGSQGQGSEAFSLVIPDERTNSLIVVGNTQGIGKIKKLVAKLDYRMRPEDAGGVYVYYVRFGDAEKISATLSGLAQASTAAATSAPSGPIGGTAPISKTTIFGGDVKVVADKTTNSLVVTASKQDYEIVQAILAKLDIARDQVFVEGVILEMNVEGKKSWGISYYNLIGDSFAGRSGFVSEPVANVLDPSKDTGAILGFGGGGQVSVKPPGASEVVKIPNLIGFINFLSSVANVNILSTPQIMALDNENAILEVGEKVPVTASSNTTAAGTTTSVTREDVTIKLDIKPHISPKSNTMRLEIDQQVQGLSTRSSGAANLQANAVTTTKRFAKTNVMVRDGDTIVLGGLMTDNEIVTVVKVPLLGDIPILGWLFKSKRTETTKQNLLMFLTPKIIRNTEDSANLLVQKMKDRVRFIEKNVGGKDAQGEYLDSLRMERNGKLESNPK